MALRRPRPRRGVRVLTGTVRVVAAVVLATAASAALADLDLQTVNFYRVLPVVLTGEGILYILTLGGGAVAGPVLLLTVALTFVLRAGIAVITALLSPQAGGGLIAGAQFYHAAYWPSAVAQVLLMALMLRVIRPLIRRKRRRPVRPSQQAEEIAEAESKELLLVALNESPDEPPESPTALEEQQIGDLVEVGEAQTNGSDQPEAQEQSLPFEDGSREATPRQDDGAPNAASTGEVDTHSVTDLEPDDDYSLPPGVIDARPGIEADESSEMVEDRGHAGAETGAEQAEDGAGEEVEETETATESELDSETDYPLPPGVVDACGPNGLTETREAQAEEAGRETAEEQVDEHEEQVVEPEASSVGDQDTAVLEPVEQGTTEFDLGEVTPPENLQEMVSVISDAAGENSEVRVWGTSDGRSVLAAVPAGTPAADTASHADGLVKAHLRLCAELGTNGDCRQLAMTSAGGWSVQALDDAGGVMLVMATRNGSKIERLRLATERTAQALRGMAATAGAVPRPREADDLPLSPEDALGEIINSTARAVGGEYVEGWRAWRGPHRRLIAAIAPSEGEAENVASMAAGAIAPVERFADAIALDGPRWLALSTDSAVLVLVWAQIGEEPAVMAVRTSGDAAIGRARWELGEIARHAQP